MKQSHGGEWRNKVLIEVTEMSETCKTVRGEVSKH